MDAREYPHRNISRIITHEHLVDLKDRAQSFGQYVCRNVREIEINLILSGNAVTLQTDLEDLSRRDIAWDKIPVRRVFFFEEVPTLVLRDIFR